MRGRAAPSYRDRRTCWALLCRRLGAPERQSRHPGTAVPPPWHWSPATPPRQLRRFNTAVQLRRGPRHGTIPPPGAFLWLCRAHVAPPGTEWRPWQSGFGHSSGSPRSRSGRAGGPGARKRQPSRASSRRRPEAATRPMRQTLHGSHCPPRSATRPSRSCQRRRRVGRSRRPSNGSDRSRLAPPFRRVRPAHAAAAIPPQRAAGRVPPPEGGSSGQLHNPRGRPDNRPMAIPPLDSVCHKARTGRAYGRA